MKTKFKCHYCHKTVHFIKDCEKRKKHEEKEKQKEESATFCKLEDRGFHPEFALHVLDDLTDKHKSRWLLDSACTKHMTGQKEDLVNYEQFDHKIDDESQYVTLADKSVVRAVGQGSLNVYLRDVDGRKIPVSFKNVLYVPNLERLISISQLTRRGAEVVFKENSVELRLGKRSFQFGSKKGKLYEMNWCFFAAVLSENNDTWTDTRSSEVTSIIAQSQEKLEKEQTKVENIMKKSSVVIIPPEASEELSIPYENKDPSEEYTPDEVGQKKESESKIVPSEANVEVEPAVREENPDKIEDEENMSQIERSESKIVSSEAKVEVEPAVREENPDKIEDEENMSQIERTIRQKRARNETKTSPNENKIISCSETLGRAGEIVERQEMKDRKTENEKTVGVQLNDFKGVIICKNVGNNGQGNTVSFSNPSISTWSVRLVSHYDDAFLYVWRCDAIGFLDVAFGSIRVLGSAFHTICVLGSAYRTICVLGSAYRTICVLGSVYRTICILGIAVSTIRVLGVAFGSNRVLGSAYRTICVLGSAYGTICVLGIAVRTICNPGVAFSTICVLRVALVTTRVPSIALVTTRVPGIVFDTTRVPGIVFDTTRVIGIAFCIIRVLCVAERTLCALEDAIEGIRVLDAWDNEICIHYVSADAICVLTASATATMLESQQCLV